MSTTTFLRNRTQKEQKLSINYRLTIRATRDNVFTALIKNNIIDAWGGGPSRFQAKPHGSFSFWDGEMLGVIREIEAPSRLAHTLLHRDGPTGSRESLVEWRLDEVGAQSGSTLLLMEHSDIPNERLCELQNELWAASFLGPLKAYLECKA